MDCYDKCDGGKCCNCEHDTGMYEDEKTTIYSDTDLLNYLQKLTDDAKYTGKVILRDSTSGRGWRLMETSWDGCVPDVREAIINYIESHK